MIVEWILQLQDYFQDFQKYIDDGTLIPGWHKHSNFIHGSANHVSASGLLSCFPPGSVKKALDPHNVDSLNQVVLILSIFTAIADYLIAGLES
jgi:hypothetical protein